PPAALRSVTARIVVDVWCRTADLAARARRRDCRPQGVIVGLLQMLPDRLERTMDGGLRPLGLLATRPLLPSCSLLNLSGLLGHGGGLLLERAQDPDDHGTQESGGVIAVLVDE